MDNILRVASCVNKISLLNLNTTYFSIESQIKSAFSLNADIIVFPQYSLTGTSLSSLFLNQNILNGANKILDRIINLSKSSKHYIIIGLPVKYNTEIISALAVIYNGNFLGYIPNCESNIIFDKNDSLILPQHSLFSIGQNKFAVASCHLQNLPFYAPGFVSAGADVLVCPSASPEKVLKTSLCKNILTVLSKTLNCAIISSNIGAGETSSPNIYKGSVAVYEDGNLLAEDESFFEDLSITADIDLDIIGVKSKKNINNVSETSPCLGFHNLTYKNPVIRKISRNPYFTDDYENFDYLKELFELQYTSLALRLKNTGIKKLVLGVSGGLDSTLSMLVSLKALDILNLPRQNLICISMPGLGTSSRTFNNSLALVDVLGASLRQISIKNAVLQHFNDIDHNPEIKNTTYENAQARERAQILLDISNTENALVVGTSDLSETALGFTTFGGDNIALFNVNVCITKTTIRMLTAFLATTKDFLDASDILNDILNTPVSPELIPSDDTAISQKTEDILGPYALHDFFLYYFIKHNFTIKKIYEYACLAFCADYDSVIIKSTLKTFIKRILTSQFKRSCSPDYANICDISFSSAEFFIPSDINPHELLSAVDKL